MRLPFKIVRRSYFDDEYARQRAQRLAWEEREEQLLWDALSARDTRDKSIKAVMEANNRVDRKFAELVALAHDLKVIALHINNRTDPNGQRLILSIELRSEMLLHGFRYDGNFRAMISYMVEEAIMREPDLRHSILSYPARTKPFPPEESK